MPERRSLFNSCNFLCHFMLDFAQVAALLNWKLRRGQLHTCDRSTENETTHLETLKVKIAELSVLDHPHLQGSNTAHTDPYKHEDWLCRPGAAIWQNRPTSRIKVLYVKPCQVHLHQHPWRVSVSSMDNATVLAYLEGFRFLSVLLTQR